MLQTSTTSLPAEVMSGSQKENSSPELPGCKRAQVSPLQRCAALRPVPFEKYGALISGHERPALTWDLM